MVEGMSANDKHWAALKEVGAANTAQSCGAVTRVEVQLWSAELRCKPNRLAS